MTWVAGKAIPVPDALSRRSDLMKATANPRDGLSSLHLQPPTDTPSPVQPIPDPAEDITPSQPLKEEPLPLELRDAPKAAKVTPEAPSKSPREELRDATRLMDQRLLSETKDSVKSTCTIGDLSNRHHDRQTLLRVAVRIANP